MQRYIHTLYVETICKFFKRLIFVSRNSFFYTDKILRAVFYSLVSAPKLLFSPKNFILAVFDMHAGFIFGQTKPIWLNF